MAASSSTTSTFVTRAPSFGCGPSRCSWSALPGRSPGSHDLPHGERESERGASSWRAPHVDRAPVGLDDRLADRQPDAARPAFTAAERLEDASPLVVGDADALVDDANLDHVASVRRLDSDGRRGWRVPGRVLEQVREHLVELAVVAVDERELGRYVDLDADLPEQWRQPAEALVHQLVEGDRLPLGLQRARLDPAHAQQV